MIWTNFAVLGVGGALLTVPVIMHLLMQPKPKKMVFPALRFVKEHQQSSRSRLRLRHFLLLLLRCLLIALVALAFAGPRVASSDFGNWLTVGGVGTLALIVGVILVAALLSGRNRNWILVSILSLALTALLVYGGFLAVRLLNNQSVQLIGDSSDPIAAIVVIDTSARMSYVSENSTRLDKAKEIGEWLVSQFPPDSQVAVLACDNDRPFFSVDVSAAKKRINTLDVNFVTSSIPATLQEGLRLLDKAEQGRKEIYVITDMTVPGWAAEKGGSVAEQIRKNEGYSVYLVDVGIEDPNNFALSVPELTNQAIPRNGQLNLTCSLKRDGPGEPRTVRLKLERRKVNSEGEVDLSRPQVRDGKTLVPEQFWERTRTVDVPLDSSRLVEFRLSEDIPIGIHHGTIEIVGDDGLAVDDRRYFTVEVRKPWKALVVHPPDVYPDNLVFALAPRQRISGEGSLFETTVISQADIDRPNLSDFQVVFLLDPKPIPNTTWGSLRRYVETGGNVGIFLGHNAGVGSDVDPTFQSENAQVVLGGKIDFQWRRPDGQLFLSPNNLAHPVLAPFRKIESGVPWFNHPIYFYWGQETDNGSEEFPTQTLVPFGNGKPAIVEREINQGRVITMMTPITEPSRPKGRKPWNDLMLDDPPPWPMFWLIRQISEYLVQSNADTLNIDVGSMAALRNDRERFPLQYRMFSPSEPGATSMVNVKEDQILYRFTDVPGHFRLKGALAEPVIRGFSTNLPAEESNLDRVDDEVLDLMLGAGNYQVAQEKEEIERKQGTTRKGREFFPLLIVMMAFVLGLENLMSNLFYKTR